MFTNHVLGEIFLINSHTNTIHAASTLSEDCGINGTQNGRFGILPCASARELAAQRAQLKAQAEEGQKGEAPKEETRKEETRKDEAGKEDETAGA